MSNRVYKCTPLDPQRVMAERRPQCPYWGWSFESGQYGESGQVRCQYMFALVTPEPVTTNEKGPAK